MIKCHGDKTKFHYDIQWVDRFHRELFHQIVFVLVPLQNVESCFEDRIDHTMTEPPMKPLLKVEIDNCNWLEWSVYFSSAWQDVSHSRPEDNKSEECQVYHLMQVCKNQLWNPRFWLHSSSDRRRHGKGKCTIDSLAFFTFIKQPKCPAIQNCNIEPIISDDYRDYKFMLQFSALLWP